MFWHISKEEYQSSKAYLDVKLVLRSITKESPFSSIHEQVDFNIVLINTNEIVGKCDLRLGMNEELYYAGNIGYRIYEKYRGHRYAYQACLILFEIAKEKYGMKRLLITCSPDNYASKKTCEYLGGILLKVCDVPYDHWLYRRGETKKCIYEYNLESLL
ncbi:MAG: GNAT family N-acetyltransferase [Solobacterium sp.]|nr:GNAT family N-acetyltransferase [Solobacterium sp.]